MNQQAQEWAGPFGTEYTRRSPGNVEANVAMFNRILKPEGRHWIPVASAIELGAGVGSNLHALRRVLGPNPHLCGIEINPMAFTELAAAFPASRQCSILDWHVPAPGYDLAFTKGVLIHIAPEHLPRAYAALYGNAKRHILVAEYYNPRPMEIEYRGRRNMLWKRDFAGELMDTYRDLVLIDYGFVYHRDLHPQDDLNWFLLEKRS